MGHSHFRYEMRDRFGARSKEAVWLFAKYDVGEAARARRVTRAAPRGVGELMVMPPFNNLVGGQAINAKGGFDFGPVLSSGTVDVNGRRHLPSRRDPRLRLAVRCGPVSDFWMSRSSATSPTAPIVASTGWPFLKTMKVGIDWTSYLVAMLRLLVDVQLPEDHLPSVLRRKTLHDGLHRPARTTPDGPEVDEDRPPVVHVPVEVGGGKRDYRRVFRGGLQRHPLRLLV